MQRWPWQGRRQLFICLVIGVSILFLLYQLLPPSPRKGPPDLAYGRLDSGLRTNRLAITTFLGENRAVEEEDYYYIATRMLTYQILHANNTKCQTDIPFVVLVTKGVSTEKQKQLTLDGATVVQAEDVPMTWWVTTSNTRWKDQFTKLRIFQMVQYDRVLFIDADTILTRPIDDIFADPAAQLTNTLFERRKEVKADEEQPPAQYVFGTRSDNHFNGLRDHPFPPLHSDQFSAGFWLAAPSQEMFKYFVSVMKHFRRFNPQNMEQSLFNYAFRTEGAMPWQELNYTWSATWPNEQDLEGGVASLHEKFWKTGPEALAKIWWDIKKDMENYWADYA
jgi:alpha-N-acetylglucosamine transferase